MWVIIIQFFDFWFRRDDVIGGSNFTHKFCDNDHA